MTAFAYRLVRFCAVLLVVISSGCQAKGRPAVERVLPAIPNPQGRETASFFGMSAAIPFHSHTSGDAAMRAATWSDMAQALERAREAGARGSRVDMWWSVIEPEPGRFDFTVPDGTIAAMRAAGQEPLPILCYTSAWAEEGAAPADAQARAAFARYAAAMVARYKNDVRYWEVWNEPNIDFFWRPQPDPAAYAALLRETYAAIKAADPGAVVVAMSTAWPDVAFMRAVYEGGAAGSFDAISFHVYDARRDESILESQILDVRRLMYSWGDGAKPMLITEIGLSTGPCPILPAVSEEEQASWIVKKHLVALASGVDRYYHFKLQDDPEERNPDGYWGLYRADGSPKLLAGAYRAMTERTAGGVFVGRAHRLEVHLGRRGDAEVQVYRLGDEYLAAAWVRRDGEDLLVRLPADGPVRVEDLHGRPVETLVPDSRGMIEATLTAEPRYLRGLSPRAAQLAALSFHPPEVHLSPGRSQTVRLRAENLLAEPLAIPLTGLLAPPSATGLRIRATPETLVVPVGGVGEALVEIALDPSPVSPFRIARFRRNADWKFTTALDVIVDEPLDVTLHATALPEGGGVTVHSTFRNLSPEPVAGAAWWRFNGAEQTASAPFGPLAPHATTSASVAVPAHEGEVAVTSELRLEHGAIARGRFRLYGQQMTATPPTIDGEMADWNDPPTVSIVPSKHQVLPKRSDRAIDAAEFSGRVMAAWTQTHFYIGVDVVDSTPMINPHPETDLWRGDSLEVYIGFPGPTRSTVYPDGFYQLVLSPGHDGANPAGFNHRPVAGRPHGPIPGLEIASRRTEKGYFLEAAIPLASLGVATVAPGQVLAFDLHLNNKRDPGAESHEEVLSWNGPGQEWSNPSGWGAAVILPDPATLNRPPRRQFHGVAREFPVSPVPTKDPAFLTPLDALPEDLRPFAAHLPPGITLLLPFDGPHELSSGYGYESTSWTHQTIGNLFSANDFFAIDVSMPIGVPIYSPADGKIITSGRRADSYGNYMVIDHGGGLRSIYAHMDSLEFQVERGEPDIYVRAGQLIGTSGTTGTRWPHLHFGLHLHSRISHSGADVGGLAVVPEPLGGYYGLRRGMELAR